MTRDITAALGRWLAAGFEQIGEIAIRPCGDGFELMHHEDRGRADFALHTQPEDARLLATFDDAGAFRPLKTAPNLRHGWKLALADITALRRALEYFYPAMLGVLLSHERGELVPVPLRTTLERQSGMYVVTRKISDAQADTMIGDFCKSDGGCLKTILWQIAPGRPITSLPGSKFDLKKNQPKTVACTIPMPCSESCNLLVAKAREIVKKTAPAR